MDYKLRYFDDIVKAENFINKYAINGYIVDKLVATEIYVIVLIKKEY